MAASRRSATPAAAAAPAVPRGEEGGSATAADLNADEPGAADIAAPAAAGNPGEAVKVREARVDLILTQRLRQCGGAQQTSSGSAEKKAVPSWVFDLGLKARPTVSLAAPAGGADGWGGAGGGKVEVEGEEEGRGREEGNAARELADVARGEAAAAAAATAGVERAAAAAAALRATQAAASGAVGDETKVKVREVVDFAGEAVEVVRVLDPRSKEGCSCQAQSRHAGVHLQGAGRHSGADGEEEETQHPGQVQTGLERVQGGHGRGGGAGGVPQERRHLYREKGFSGAG
ncbi:hypothetical protein CLOP_g6597 [Closterium sp. NIES-67]|nr:hypothetical protein CLOP_g6597 [Closterium sp. NIES-67]